MRERIYHTVSFLFKTYTVVVSTSHLPFSSSWSVVVPRKFQQPMPVCHPALRQVKNACGSEFRQTFIIGNNQKQPYHRTIRPHDQQAGSYMYLTFPPPAHASQQSRITCMPTISALRNDQIERDAKMSGAISMLQEVTTLSMPRNTTPTSNWLRSSNVMFRRLRMILVASPSSVLPASALRPIVTRTQDTCLPHQSEAQLSRQKKFLLRDSFQLEASRKSRYPQSRVLFR